MEFRSILSYLGTVLEVMGIVCILPVFIAWIYGENTHTLFFITAVISFVLGIFLDRKFRKKELTISSAMVLASMSMIVISFVGIIPFLWNLSPLDALFESVSGFTTTGLTTVKPETLPFSLIFWRSLTQWAGGLGILVIFLYLVNSPGISSYYGRKPEADEIKKKSFVRKAMLIYGAITFVGFILLLLAGLGGFDSIVTSLSSVSTGGFSTKNASIAAYDSIFVEFIVMILMIAGATSFLLIEGMTRGKFRDYIRSAETRLFWSLIVLFTILVSFAMFEIGQPARHALFLTVSALTTGGFTTLETYSGLTILLLLVLMIIGGYSASTAGGMKLVRAGIIGKSFPWIGKKVTLPQEAIVPLKYDERVIRDSEVTTVAIFVAIYVLFLFGSAVILTFMGYPPLNSLFQAASAQGNVGLSAIPMETINPLGKLLLMVNMLLGRLEIFPVMGFLYVLVKTQFGRKDIVSG
ncbi:MAG: TrkH family potassium uptake protein [Candidatus Aenigmarchaeota archaeon]|nr:TrkH family potassium uptake protein [Candidatus Aenigmarchaeota archaeon]